MKSTRISLNVASAMIALGAFLIAVPALHAQETDLWSNIMLPDTVSPGVPIAATLEYGNDGPDTAVDAYPTCEFIPPMGLAALIDDLNNGAGTYYTDILASAVDSLGNIPLLYWEDFYCEFLTFEVQGPVQPGPTPIQSLASGESGEMTFELTLPMDAPKTGTVEITTPLDQAKSWTLTNPSNFWVGEGYATQFSKYSSSTCVQIVGGPEDDICDFIDENCWGSRVSQLQAPIEAEFALVDDGSADPTFACFPITNDVQGKIAVIRRGTCEFGLKGLYAEQAGALAVFMVNNGLCSPPDFPDSDQCVINMGAGVQGDQVSLPVIMVSQADGEAVISAMEGGANISGIFGSGTTYPAHGWTFLDPTGGATDPNDDNDVSVALADVAIFADGFESGETTAWSGVTL